MDTVHSSSGLGLGVGKKFDHVLLLLEFLLAIDDLGLGLDEGAEGAVGSRGNWVLGAHVVELPIEGAVGSLVAIHVADRALLLNHDLHGITELLSGGVGETYTTAFVDEGVLLKEILLRAFENLAVDCLLDLDGVLGLHSVDDVGDDVGHFILFVAGDLDSGLGGTSVDIEGFGAGPCDCVGKSGGGGKFEIEVVDHSVSVVGHVE